MSPTMKHAMIGVSAPQVWPSMTRPKAVAKPKPSAMINDCMEWRDA